MIDLMQRLVAGPQTEEPVEKERSIPWGPEAPVREQDGRTYWLSPVKASKEETAEECIRNLVGEAGSMLS